MSGLSWSCPACGQSSTEVGSDRRACHCGLCWRRQGGVWRAQTGHPPAGFDHAGMLRLAGLDQQGHFWGVTRRVLIADLLVRLAPQGPGALIDLGCGGGLLLARLEERAERAVGVDAWPELLAAAAARCHRAEFIEADVCAVPLAGEQFDTVLALDVLEHVEPDRFLREARRLARGGSRIVVSVPAFQWLWSEMDARAGHRCRYRRAQLAAELARNGWLMEGCTHFQFLLFPLVLASRLRGGAGEGERRPPRWLNRLLAGVNRLEIALFRGIPLPWGSSLIAWARAV